MGGLFEILLYVGLFTFHGNSYGANSVHTPVGIEIQYEDHGYGILHFSNSFGDPSATAYITGKVKENSIRINYLAGVVQGYTDLMIPYILPVVSARYGNLSSDLSCMPNANNHVNCAITFKMGWSR